MATAFSERRKAAITPFNVLLGTISNNLNHEDIRRLKLQLQGHINKESLDKLKGGIDLVRVLQQLGFVTEKKLAFFRRLLVECELHVLAGLVDEYKQALQNAAGGDSKLGGFRQRMQDLKRLAERQRRELANYLSRAKDLQTRLGEKDLLLDTQKEILFVGEECVKTLVEQRDQEERERSVIEERAQESEAIIKVQQGELQCIQDALKNAKPSKSNQIANESGRSQSREGKRKTIFDTVLSKHSADKSKKAVGSLNKQREEKQETLQRMSKADEELREQLYKKRASVRLHNEAINLKINELSDVDQHIMETMEDIRKLKQQIRWSEVEVVDLRRQLEETVEEEERTLGNDTSYAAAMRIPLYRLQPTREKTPKIKVLSYEEVYEENSYSLGSLGMRTVPLQLNFPCDISVSRKGQIYVADHANCRLMIINEVGELIREPIQLGNINPTAIAINKRGNVVVTDSQIIKVFSSDGALSHNFLPVFSKKDNRPEISDLTVDGDGNILVVDRSNHRVQKFRVDGQFIGYIGGSAYLHSPSGIAVTKNGDVIVSESGNHQLKVFHHHGNSYDVIGKVGAGKALFMNPRGLAVDNAGNILVADSLNHRIQVLTIKGEFVSSFGRLGSGPGCLDTPYAVAVGRRGHVMVADSGNHRITIFT